MKKIAIFSGSFNPIHIGHLALANYICELGWIDELWFMVTPHNPLKSTTTLAPDHARLEMVKLAINGYDKFKASSFEFNLPQPSYTIKTLEALKLQYPECNFHLLIGADNWHLFDQWKDSNKIIDQFNLLIYPRVGYPVDQNLLPNNVQYVDSPVIEVSSTFIRENIENGKDFRYFLHPSVHQFITDNKLYIKE